MLKSSHRGFALLAAALLLLTALPAFAQTASRVGMTVKDEAGNPLEGVKITASHPPTGLVIERTTNKKGKTTFAFRNGSLNYEVALELEGYDPATTSLKPRTGAVSYQTYTLYKTRSSAPVPSTEEGGTREIPLTPAQEMFNEGVSALQAEDIETAETKFLEALTLDPELHQTHSALAAIYLEKKDFAKAKASAQVIVENDPGSGRGYRMLYEALSGLGETEAAEEVLATLSKMEAGADAVPLIFNEGTEALRMGDMGRAQERLEKALSMDPELHRATRLLAIVYLNQDDFQRAAEAAEAYLLIDPEDLTLKKLRVDAYKGLGDEAKAAEAYAELAEADPATLAADLYQAGKKEFNANDTDAALSTLKRVVELDPDHGMSHYLLGLCYVNKGQNAEAKRHLEKFVALMPDHQDAATAKEMIGFLQ